MLGRSRTRLLASAVVWTACGGPAAPEPPAPVDVSSQACAGCHPAQTRAWAGSHHALAERDVAAVAGVFGAGGPVVSLADAHGPAPRPVVRVIGVEPLWQPLIAMDGGRLQTSNLAWDPGRREWFDVFGDARAPGEWGHWTGGGMTWNSQCAHCHDTGVERGWDPATGTYQTTFDELGVGCAACHGDPTAHVRDPKHPTTAPSGKEPTQATCERCHTRGLPLVDDPPAGAPLLDVLLPAMPGADTTWWPDGQIREEAFEGAVFRTSRMHAAGVRCADCHDPHSGATVRQGDALCLGCHGADPAITTHTHHTAGAGSPSCVDCHMPTTTYMQRDPRHDHGFRIPDPLLSKELGSPSACAACHPDTTANLAAAAAWWPPHADTRERARTIAAAQAGAPDTTARLAAALAREPHPFWRSVLIAAGAPPSGPLDAWGKLARASTPAGLDRVPEDVTTADPLAVRLATARAALTTASPDPALDDTLRRWLTGHTDFGGVALTLGTWHAVRGQTGPAMDAYRRATAQDPGSGPAWHGLAVTQAAAGRSAEAVTTLDQAIVHVPGDAELHFARGLALAGTGRVAEAKIAFLEVLRLDPTHPRAAYNAGLAAHQLGDDASAITLLRRAMAIAPADPGPAYALATVLFARGDRAGANAAAQAALTAAPDHAEARALLDRLAVGR